MKLDCIAMRQNRKGFHVRGTLFSLWVWLVVVSPTLAQTGAPSEEVSRYVAVDAPVVGLTHAQVIDGTGADPKADQTIVIEDGVITAIGPSAEVVVPAGAETHDLSGQTVIPGFVGMHNHTFYTTDGRRVQGTYTAPRLYLAGGVTTIRTTGSYHPYSELSLKASIDRGESPGPRIHVTGPYLTGGTGVSYMTQLSGPDDARRVVGYWAGEGATWFKAYTRITRAELGAVIEEAHSRGLKVTGHLCSVSFREAVELGIDNLEHGFFTNTDFVPDKPADVCPDGFRTHLAEVDPRGDDAQATIRAMIDNGVALTSTQAIYEGLVPGRPPLDPRLEAALTPAAYAEVVRSREEVEANAATSVWSELFPRAQAFEKAFFEAGGLLAAGVDPTGFGDKLPGFGDQYNYELLIESGFTPAETIRIMTLNGATILGEEDRYGSIEVGKLAELAVIDGDPVESTSDIRNVVLVFKNGLGFDSAKLIESVRGQVGVR